MNIIGHRKNIEFLEKSLVKGKIAHAYLFTGAEHLGKMTAALELAKSLQCQGKKKPCGHCKSCLDIDKRIHPDIMIVEPGKKEDEENKWEPIIKIDQIRNLEHSLSLFPYQSPFKVAIVDQAERIGREAANTFLKTLEEPSAKSVIILVSSGQLLPTITSRCQIINFLPVSLKEVEKYLISQKLDKNRAEEIARWSNGRPGLAISALNNPEELDRKQQDLKELNGLVNSSYLQRYQYVQKITKDSADLSANLKNILDNWLSWFRDILLINQNCQDLIANISQKENLLKQAKRYQSVQLKEIIRRIEKTIFLILKTKTNPKLALEVLILNL